MVRLEIKKKVILLYTAALLVIGLALFLPAGTLDYWQAWVYMAILFVPMLFVGLYFLKNDPEFLERRFKLKEKEAKQDLIQKVGIPIFIIGFLLPGLDHRFGWSNTPFGFVFAADVIVFLGYALIFLVFRENSYAGRTVRVEKGQKVISTGPYSVIRHPMYFGTIFLYLATPIALGSYVAVLPFLLLVPILVFRILNEEEVLRRELPGYKEYCKKVRYRLIPFVW
ncbi:MAG: isoprenylcysteine carboxylmethyltransferase family protein [Candidatus Micrarchaeota archaeon]|nr:isoprenylcysteine carboxylmethyltransferase family protein [Candidatus Micrarchaeota archaeon]